MDPQAIEGREPSNSHRRSDELSAAVVTGVPPSTPPQTAEDPIPTKPPTMVPNPGEQQEVTASNGSGSAVDATTVAAAPTPPELILGGVFSGSVYKRGDRFFI